TDSSAGPEFVNSGLRFPIIKALLNNMSGDIWIESEIGKGKTFVMAFIKTGGSDIRPSAKTTAVPLQDTSFKPTAAPRIEPVKPTAPPPASGVKIQRNVMSDIMPGKTEPEPPKKEAKSLTLGDLLSFDDKDIDKKVKLPGKDVQIPPDLLKDTKVPEKKTKAASLPDELPPLPNIELEDDKGTIT